jgi:DNA-binding NarL/FixJ family response regulator
MEVVPPDRIVIADDDAPTREFLRTLLSFAPSVQVVGEAADGAEAIRLALSRRADAVVLDVNMPGLDGGRAAEVIRAYRPRVKVLFHTAEVDGALRRRAERLDAPILLKGDPEFALHALNELLAETSDYVDPIVALVVAALERNNCDGVVVVDEQLKVLFYDNRASELLGSPVSEPLQDVLERARASSETTTARVADGRVDVRAVPLREGGQLVGIAAYVAAVS